MSFLKRFAPHVLVLFISLVFLDSLRYKFTNHPNTQEIFGRLDAWAASFGAPGLFAQTGLFSQYVIGAAELLASLILILTTVFARYRVFQPVGALLGMAVMTGAVNFHLWTPLGVNVNEDGGALFASACGVWACCLAILIIRRSELAELWGRMKAFAAPMAR